jgi:hypothetical protein
VFVGGECLGLDGECLDLGGGSLTHTQAYTLDNTRVTRVMLRE